jgi:hypothetical protein
MAIAGIVAVVLVVFTAGVATAQPLDDFDPGGTCNGAIDTNCTCEKGQDLCEDGEKCGLYIGGACVVG